MRVRADDRLLRIGNAAGEAHPIIGEGMSMALQSAGLLCAELLAPADARAAAAALAAPCKGDPCSPACQRDVARRYARAWRRAFVPRLRLAAWFAHAAMRPAPSSLLISLAARWPALLTQGACWGGKVDAACPAAAMAALQSLGADRFDAPPPEPHGAARRSLRKIT